MTAGNAYLADRARKAGAVHVEVVPTVVDLSAYSVRFRSFSNTAVRVGWIGTPNTWNAFGKTLHIQINDTLVAHGARFCAVGAELEAGRVGNLELIAWSEDTEVDSIQSMDIGVMPLPDTPWAAWQVRLQADTVYGLWLASCGLTSRREQRDRGTRCERLSG